MFTNKNLDWVQPKQRARKEGVAMTSTNAVTVFGGLQKLQDSHETAEESSFLC